MSSHRRTVAAATLAALSLLAAACSSSGSGSGGDTFKFGAMIPLSGPDSALGTQDQQAVDLALSKLNSGKTLGSTKLSVVYRDSPGTAETAVTDFQKLTTIDHVSFSFTSFSSATTAVAPLAATSKVVLLNAGATTSEFRGMSPYLFSSIPLGDQQAAAMLDYTKKTLNKSSLAAIYSNDAQGSDFKKQITADWRKLGGNYAGGVTVSTSQTDFGPAIAQLKSMHPEAVYLGLFGSGQGDIIKQATAAGLHTTWLGSTSFDNEGALKIAGSAANGVYSTQVQAAHSQDAQDFVAAYKKKYGSAPSSFAELIYSGVEVLGQVIQTLHKQKKDLTGSNIRTAMLGQTFHTVTGDLKFSNDGTVQVPIQITLYRNGSFASQGQYVNGAFSKAAS